jgi:hypothetical protein
MCLWIIFRITFSKSLLVVEKRLILENIGFLLAFDNVMILIPSKELEIGTVEDNY